VLESDADSLLGELTVVAQSLAGSGAPEILSEVGPGFAGPDTPGVYRIVAALGSATGEVSEHAWLVDVPDREPPADGLYDIPTFDEIIALAAREGAARGRVVGLYPETKWPAEHAAAGLDMAGALVGALTAADLDGADAPVFIQSFEPEILKTLNTRIGTRRVQLVYPEGWQPGAPANISLAEIATYAQGAGPYKSLLMDPETGVPTGYAAEARALGLAVHTWTFRDDDKPAWAATPEDEIRAALAAGATGIFTDFPATGVRATEKP
jgi:glycerophosphoryl diester phosphodiesterase